MATINPSPNKKQARPTATKGMAKRNSKPRPSKTVDKADVHPDGLLERLPQLKTTLQQIEKEFGQGAIMQLGASQHGHIDGISTGCLSLDIALGGFGVPRGRVIEMFGPESSGKTTLALHVVANAQVNDGVAAFIDAEHALDPTWAKKLGVQLETLLVSQSSLKHFTSGCKLLWLSWGFGEIIDASDLI